MRGYKTLFIPFLMLLMHGIPYAQPPRLVFSPHWLPQAQFAGFYVAMDQGFYKDAGIDVEIKHLPASINALTCLEQNTADIVSLFLTTALEARRNGTDLVNIAQFSEHSAIVLVSKKEKGIDTLEDISGKKIGVWKSGFGEVPKALIRDKGIDAEWVPILSSVNLFLMDGIDLMAVMWYNEYNQIYLAGINENELNTFFMKDFGYDIPEDGLYVTSSVLSNRKNELKAFTEASIRGWEYASRNQDYAINLVIGIMKEAKVSANISHQKWMLEKILKVQGFTTVKPKSTTLSEGAFARTLELLEKQAAGKYPVVYEDFFMPVLPGN